MFDAARFESRLNTRWLGHVGRFFDELDSTNSYLKKLPAAEISHGMICLADNQTRGRGQYERSWESAPGENLTFTLCFCPPSPERLHILTLTCALILLRETEEELAGEDGPAGGKEETGEKEETERVAAGLDGIEVVLKWPNDVLVNGRKVAGLLTETVFNGNVLDRVVVGIGLNVNQTRFPEALEGKATSLRLRKGEKVDREAFLARFLTRLEYGYARWHKNSKDLLREINRSIMGHGRWVRLEVNGDRQEEPCKFLGVNEEGRLLVVDKEGGIKSFSYEQIRLVPA